MNTQQSTINILVGRIYRQIPAHYITHLVGEGCYTWIYTTDGKRYITAKGIGKISCLLPEFLQLNRSCLVNPDYISSSANSIEKTGQVRLKNGVALPVSRRRKIVIAGQVNLH